ncbi:MAG: ATP-dependent DNA helicase RecG [Bacteroidota bacterium]|nr:ATP-dependent DNA helicase RecG [Bacteroidota bacterium]
MKLYSEIRYLKGIGESRAELLKKELGLQTIEDMLYHFPLRYIDRTKILAIREVKNELSKVQLLGTIGKIKKLGNPRKPYLVAEFFDPTGQVNLIWFKQIQWIQKNLQEGSKYLLFGKPSRFKGQFSFSHPELSLWTGRKSETSHFAAVYPSTEMLKRRKLDQKVFRDFFKNLFDHPDIWIPENLPDSLINKHELIPRSLAFKNIHIPKNQIELNRAIRRLKFEELFFLQLRFLLIQKGRKTNYPGILMPKIAHNFNEFFKKILPFDLTEAQKKVIAEIQLDLKSGHQMNRLLQGDVGSGKTIVALLIALIAIDNGCQVAIMAPTEILAQQHYKSFSDLLFARGIKIGLLTGSTKTSERKKLDLLLKNGDCQILIGTHALIENHVQFKKLGLVVIDEQHRFGVAQRARLLNKGNQHPHFLVMTATPIPRTMALSFYGDLDVSKINELPLGRKPIKTAVRSERERLRVYQFVKEEIKKGRQVYFVYPLIEASDKLNYKNLYHGFDQLVSYFERPAYQLDMLHGGMTPAEKRAAMKRFEEGVSHILVATTVVEVGVNVPNATIMIIESSEKFGLSQLHQLRGRVGRGKHQSYCIMMAGTKISETSQKRLAAMVHTNDGFKLAEYDLKLRGPGEMDGTRQSGGPELKLTSIVEDEQLLIECREAAQRLILQDPNLDSQENKPLKNYLKSKDKLKDWSNIA